MTTPDTLTRIVAVALFIELLLLRWRARGTAAEGDSMPLPFGSLRLAMSARFRLF